MKKQRFLIVLVIASALALNGCNAIKPSTTLQEKEIGLGWSANSVNTVIFRQNAVTTFNTTQFTAYYDQDAHVV
ncbi:MAG: neuraminidase, partial [Bacteroidota bacterium]|nr:neuraminidase [Bacteroidota bacterium]